MKQLKTVLFSALLLSLPTLFYAQTADVQEGCAPLSVNFTAPAGAPGFYWDFGDGAFSTLENPSRTYVNPGTYEVKFSYSQGGQTVGDIITIRVFSDPEVDILADKTSGCVPLDVTLTSSITRDTAIIINNYSWDFGDGSAPGSGAMIMHTYNRAGIFTPSLAINTNYPSCNKTVSADASIKVNESPSVNFTTNPASPLACNPPLNVSFTNISVSTNPVTYEWDFGNGNTFSGVNPPAQNYDQIGQFTASLIGKDSIGCADTFSVIVGVGSPIANFSAPDTACAGVPVLFTNLSPNGFYLWEFDTTSDPPFSTDRNANAIFFFEGTYDIFLSVRDTTGMCSSDTTIQIYIDAVDASFVTAPTDICFEPVDLTYTPNSSEGVSFNWRFGDGSTSNEQMPTRTFVSPDTTTYGRTGLIIDSTYLEIFNARGCKGFLGQADTIILPNALFIPDTTMGCAPLTVEFSDLSTSFENIVRWTYLFGDGSSETFTNNDPIQHTFTQAGDYPVRLVIENEAGCTDTSYAIVIEVGEPLSPDFAVDKTTICPGDTVFFTDLTNDPRVDAWHYLADNGRLSHCFNEPNPFWVFNTETGVMDVTLEVLYNGCKSEIVKDDLITVNGPIAKIDYKIECDDPFNVMFADSSYEATTIKWYFGDGDSSMVASPVHTYAAIGNYEVVLVAGNDLSGCPELRDTVGIYIRDIEAKFELADTYCQGTPFMLDASQSEGVNATCWKGYTWFFTDNRPITTQEASIEYAFQGRDTQSVTLIVEDINGCRDTISDTTTVFKATAEFLPDDNKICIPGQVNFTDFSTGDTTLVDWEWMFGDGSTSEDRNPSHTYTTPPPGGQTFFNVRLLVRDKFECTDSINTRIEVYTPFSTITTIPGITNICVGDEIIFSASDFDGGGSRLLFNWDFGNGQNSQQQSDTIQYNNAGTYPVNLFFEEEATGCSGTTSVNVNVQDYPTANFTTDVDGLSIICGDPERQIVFFNNSTNPTSQDFDSVSWDFGNTVMSSGDTVSATYPKGTYTVTLIVKTTFGCSDTTSRSFTVVAPEGNFDLSDDIICVGDPVTATLKDTADVSSFRWDFGDGAGIEDENPVTHTYDRAGTFELILALTGQEPNCRNKETKIVEVIEVTADFAAVTACNQLSVDFENNSIGANSFTWDFGDGSATSNLENPSHVYGSAGNYEVRLIARNTVANCTDTIKQMITVSPQLEIIITGDDNICTGDSVVLSISNPEDSWTISWLGLNSNEAIIEVSPLSTTTYTVSITDTSGCEGTGTFTIVVNQAPNVNGDTLYVLAPYGGEPQSVVLPSLPQSVASFNITWSESDSIDIMTNILQPVVTRVIKETIALQAVVVDPNGCGRDTFVRIIKPVRVPNVFSPNNDMTNDRFNIVIPNESEEGNIRPGDIEDFKVYNRWGQVVYENTNPTLGWDGTHNGDPAPSDVYIYVIKIRTSNESTSVLKGDVTLLR